jgi:NAD(P)H dehydrogenase (quinone)
LEFCGVKPVKVTYIGTVKTATNDLKTKWLNKVENIGRKLK